VDVRHNNGGHAELADPLVAVFRELRRQRPGLPVFVLTGRNTFSAAQIFITRMDREAAPIFAGEPSSSKPNFVGEENVIRLPWSGALCSISNRHHEPAPGDRRAWIAPRIAMELRAADYFANRDPLLEAVRRFTP
jgi:hypothetical protein